MMLNYIAYEKVKNEVCESVIKIEKERKK